MNNGCFSYLEMDELLGCYTLYKVVDHQQKRLSLTVHGEQKSFKQLIRLSKCIVVFIKRFSLLLQGNI